MMKKLIFLIVALSAGLMAYSQKKEPKVLLGYPTGNSTNPGYVNGKLKEFTQVSYAAKMEGGKIVKGEKLKYLDTRTNSSLRHTTFYFNKAGEITRVVGYDDNNKPAWSADIINKDGQIQKASWMSNDTLLRYETFSYDNKALKEFVNYDARTNKIISKAIFQCNKDGYFVKHDNFDANAQKVGSAEYERDDQGRILIVKNMNKDGVVVSQTNYSYSTENRFEPASMDTKIWNMKDVDIKGRRQVEFDKQGNWIRFIRYKDDIPVNMTERTYVFY